MATRLFVGGCADGERKDTEDRNPVKVPVHDAKEVSETALEFGLMQYQLYVLSPWRIGAGLFFIYAPEKQTPEETFKLLMNSYTPKSAEDLAV